MRTGHEGCIWIVEFEPHDHCDESCLDAASRQRYEQMAVPQRRRLFALRRRARQLIEQALPSGAGTSISSSHSGRWFAFYVGNQAVGIDLEQLGGPVDLAALAEHFPHAFPPGPGQPLPAPLRALEGHLRWSRLEAEIKHTGQTLHQRLAQPQPAAAQAHTYSAVFSAHYIAVFSRRRGVPMPRVVQLRYSNLAGASQ
ncbi:hypothetical protein [Pseudomonas sp. KNUC1026]|uniref:hypothetical protein n=1 Tax=Pseudomonas sp. KNUC1026 TaxID=2893890 RepID=UPI001F2B1AF5|nr:hypothetical protein [Pseudomonas sp. KNUC1026]UFH50195.1 hypothetical protein LN139_02400 [Pseudomonas sp. KNUC1026]